MHLVVETGNLQINGYVINEFSHKFEIYKKVMVTIYISYATFIVVVLFLFTRVLILNSACWVIFHAFVVC